MIEVRSNREWRERFEKAEAQLEAERKAHEDLARSILDGSHPNLVLERKRVADLLSGVKEANKRWTDEREAHAFAVDQLRGIMQKTIDDLVAELRRGNELSGNSE